MGAKETKIKKRSREQQLTQEVYNKKYDKLKKDLKKIRNQKELLVRLMGEFDKRQEQMVQSVKKLEKKYDAVLNENDDTELLSASLEMQEIQMSFNLQYLQLQSQMQNENRSYTAVSNIMKIKHDTVKNSLANIK